MAVDVRLLRADDEAVLANVAPDVFDDPVVPAAAAEFLRDARHRIAVATDGDVVVGFVSGVLYLHPDEPRPELWINEVGVAPTHRRRGIGRALLAVMLDDARAEGCAEAWVLTDRSNDAALRLYTAAGGISEDAAMFTFRLEPSAHRRTHD